MNRKKSNCLPAAWLMLVLCIPFLAGAQNHFTVSGYVKDKESGEDLIGARVVVKGGNEGAVTNNYGYYVLNLAPGAYILRAGYLGYQNLEQTVNLNGNLKLDFLLPPQPRTLEEVKIQASSQRKELEQTQMSKVEITVEKAKELPAIFGEVDVLKTLQLMPGIQSGTEGSSGLYVRGGGPDQNLIVLDEAIVYNPAHLFGFFSVFNPDAVKNVELYKGGYPAQYGGRLSSVVDVSMKEGNKEKFVVTGGLGLIASRLTLEGPIIKNKSSFIISGRRTYVDVFTGAYNKIKEKDSGYNPIPGYYFYDLTAKVNYELGGRDRLFLSGYFGRDVFSFNRGPFDFGFHWGNSIGTMRWNHLFTPKLFLNTTAVFSDYFYDISNTSNAFHFDLGSRIQDWSGKADFSLTPNSHHYVRFGALTTYHRFLVSRVQIGTNDNSFNLNQDNELYGTEMGAYIGDDWTVSAKWKLNYGFRLSGFLNKTSFYNGLEPRLSAVYLASKNISLKASYTGMNQYMQLVSSSGASLPTDIWYPSTQKVGPQKSQQLATGIDILLFGEKLLLTDEVYYKWLQHQIDYKPGAQLFLNNNLEEEFVFGRGWAYGNEIFLQKREGRFTGWAGYTLSWSWRLFPDISPNAFPPKYDRRHDVSLVASYELSRRWTLSATWVYGTGTAFTLPYSWFYINDVSSSKGFPIDEFYDRNALRMPPYHRLDFAAVWKFYPKWGNADLTFSIYNVYNRRNPFQVYIDQAQPQGSSVFPFPTGARLLQISLFPIIPSVTFNFKF